MIFQRKQRKDISYYWIIFSLNDFGFQNLQNIYKSMFKKCKESKCLNRQMVQFFVRQFNFLKQLASNIGDTEVQIISQRIFQSVQLMEKRILFVLDQKTTEQFHDYISDFYEAKLQKISNELNKELKKSKIQQEKIRQILKQVKNRDEIQMRGKPLDYTTINENMSLKNELVHSKKLLNQNQQIMQEQNKAIQELNSYILQIQQRQNESRDKLDGKIKQLNEIVNQKKRFILIASKDFQNQHKRLQKEYRQITMENLLFMEEKDRLQNQIVIKTEEVKLLTKKIYDQSLIINKFERTLNHNQGILIQEKIENNRTYDQNKHLRQKVKMIEQEYQLKLLSKNKLLNELQEKVNKNLSFMKDIQSQKNNLQSLMLKNNAIMKNKDEQWRIIEHQSLQWSYRYKQAQKQLKKSQRKQKQMDLRIKELQQILNQRQRQFIKCKEGSLKLRKQFQISKINHQEQKEHIKQDIGEQFNKLVSLNKETLALLHKKQEEFIKLNNLYTQTLIEKRSLLEMNDRVRQAFEDAKNKLLKIQQQKDDQTYCRKQLQLKLQNLQRKCEQYLKYQQQYLQIKKNTEQIQSNYIQSKKLIKEKENELQTFKKILKEEHNSYNNKNKQNVQSFKEETNKKEFVIKQLHSKINILQEELRQNEKAFFNQKQRMKNKIQQLEDIIQQRFDISNRIIDSSIQ